MTIKFKRKTKKSKRKIVSVLQYEDMRHRLNDFIFKDLLFLLMVQAKVPIQYQ